MKNPNVATPSFAEEFSQKISPLIGYRLGVDHIHSDQPGYYYYIQKLTPGRPVLAMHYRGPLMAVLPDADFQRLENGDVTVDEYIAQSHFYFGRYWGGGSMLGGGYWQPLEAAPGVHDTARISRYLTILSCRTFTRSCGYRPSEENCRACSLDCKSCPCSPLNETGDWQNETQEPDSRILLFKALRRRIEAELGFEIGSFVSHSHADDELELIPSSKTNEVQLLASAVLLNDLLYHPTDCDWDEYAKRFKFVATKFYPHYGERVVIDQDDTDPRQTCLDFWGENTQKAWERWDRVVEEMDGTAEPTETPADPCVATSDSDSDSILPTWLRNLIKRFTRK